MDLGGILEREYVSPKEAAEILGCSRSAIYENIRHGGLPSSRLYNLHRIKLEDLRDWVALHRSPSEDESIIGERVYFFERVIGLSFRGGMGEIREYLQKLDAREANILANRYGLIDGERKTLSHLSEEHQISRERVRQIHRKAEAEFFALVVKDREKRFHRPTKFRGYMFSKPIEPAPINEVVMV